MSLAVLRRLWQFDPTLISKRTAFRDAVAVVVALVTGLVVGGPQIAGVMAIGAVGTAMADGPDTVRVRVVRLFISACALSLSAFVGAVTGGEPWLAVPALALWAFTCGLVVVLGVDATTVGLNSIVVFVVLENYALDPWRAAGVAGLVFGGGLIAIVASALAWPTRVSPPQRAIATAYLHLAELAAVPPHGHEIPPVSAPLAAARASLLHFGGSQHVVRGEALQTLVDQAERLRLAVLSLEEWRDVELDRHDPSGPPVSAALAALGPALRGIATALLRFRPASGAAEACATIEAARERIVRAGDAGGADPVPAAIVRTFDAVMGQLRAAEAAVADAVTGFDLRAEVVGALYVPIPPFRSALATLRANLSLRSTAYRHALRLAACVTVAETIGHVFNFPRSYWLPMTAALVLKPDFAETFTRGTLRVVGTLLGIVLAFGLHRAGIANDAGRIAIIFVAVFVARSFGRPNYAVLTTSITVYIVELLAISGQSIDRTIGERTLDTLLGGGLALAFYVAWPTWESGRLGSAVADLIAAYRTYWGAIVARLQRGRAGEREERTLMEARSASRLARTNAQASLDRARAEPSRRASEVNAYAGVLAAAHRFVLSALRVEMGAASLGLSGPLLAFAKQADRTLEIIEATLRGAPLPDELPDLRAAHRLLDRDAHDDLTRFFAFEADNVANSLDTIVDLLRATEARANMRRKRARRIKRLRRVARPS